MNITSKHYNKILNIIQMMNDHLEAPDFRLQLGELLLDLLKADQFASFRWQPLENKYDDGVVININERNIDNYKKHYQYHDPITRPLAMKKESTIVTEVISQKKLLSSEFYNDFLKVDGLYHGINLHLYDELGDNVGDVRIWRKKGKGSFDSHSCQLLNILKPHLINATKNNIRYKHTRFGKNTEPSEYLESNVILLKEKYLLTPKEIEVTFNIIQGVCDDRAATQLHISKTTLRTHLKHIFQKTHARNRTELTYLVSTIC